MDIQPYTTEETLGVGRPWLLNTFGTETNRSATLDLTAFTEGIHWTAPSAYQPQRKLKSGIPLGKNTTTGLYEPYAAVTNEVQAVTITGTPTGGTFTLTFSGQTTAAIAYNATATQVQAALVALSNIAAGDVTVAGGPLPGTALSVTFGGQYLGNNVAAMTATGSLTGGSSPAVAITTTTAGGTATATDGTQLFAGLLDTEVSYYPTSTKVAAPLRVVGQVSVSKLPVAFDPADMPAGSNTHIVFED